MLRTALFLALAATAVGCDPYDPDLGPTPFRCGGDDNACPDGYTCNVDIDVCEKTGTGATIDGPSFACGDDTQLEPNDMPTQAYIMPVPSSPSYTLAGLSICPATDVDTYRFGVDATGTNFEALVVGMSDRASLVVDLLNSNGTIISSGTPVDGSPQQVKIELSNRLPVGNYFVRVKAADATQNNYNVTIKTCTTPLPCP